MKQTTVTNSNMVRAAGTVNSKAAPMMQQRPAQQQMMTGKAPMMRGANSGQPLVIGQLGTAMFTFTINRSYSQLVWPATLLKYN